MTDENPSVVVDTTKEIPKGKLKVSWNPFNGLPTPTILARTTKALRYFSVALIGLVSASDLFSGLQAKKVNFCLSVFIYFTGVIDIMIGVEPDKAQRAGILLLIAMSTLFPIF